MEFAFTWIGIALAALIGVAVSVAAWEHHRLVAARKQARFGLAPSAPAPAASHQPMVATVDVDVDAFTQPPRAATPGDSADRRATLEQALGRLSCEPAAALRPVSWVDTEPMIGPGVTTAPPRSPSKAHSA